jgi:hypothetical protein
MIFYKKLPLSLRNLVLRKDIDPIKMVEPFNLKGHNWALFDPEELITNEGFEFFNNLGISLNKQIAIFKIEKDFTGSIHIDSAPHIFAFNFIMSGEGVIQWVNVDGDKFVSQYEDKYHTSNPFLRWDTIGNIEIIDSTDFSDILVRVDVPHRVVGGKEDRYVISVRPKWPCPLSFEEIVTKLNL